MKRPPVNGAESRLLPRRALIMLAGTMFALENLAVGGYAESPDMVGAAPVLLMGVTSTNSADQPTASLIAELIRHEIEQAPGIKNVPPSAIRKALEEQGIAGGECSERTCMFTVGRALRVPFLLSGAQSKTSSGDDLDISLYDVRLERMIYSVHALFEMDEDMTPKLRAAVNQAAAVVSDSPVAALAGSRTDGLKRLGRKEPTTAALLSIIPGAGMLYARQPAWAAAYFLVDSPLLALGIYRTIRGEYTKALAPAVAGAALVFIGMYHSAYAVRQYNGNLRLAISPYQDGGVMVSCAIRFK